MLEESFNLGKYRCRVLYNDRFPGVPVILLHGYSFTSDVWVNIGLLDLFEEEKIPYVAIDMPYGAKSTCSPRTRDRSENVWVAREVAKGLFRDAKPLLIGASLGGYVALHYIVSHPASGAVLVSPVGGLEEELKARYPGLSIPVLIIRGSRDKVVSRRELEELARLLDAQYVEYEDAGHPAYLDDPGRFKRDVLAFYRAIHLE